MNHARTIQLPRSWGASGSAVLAMKAAVSTIVQRRNGAREPARVLYYRAHSLLRTLRQCLGDSPRAA